MSSHAIATTSTTLPAVVDNAAESWVTLFLAAQTSPNTRSAYRTDLTRWREFCDAHSIDSLTAHRPHVDAWVHTMTELRPTTIARRLATLSSFYSYMIDAGQTLTDPTANVKRPKTSEAHVTLTPGLDTADARQLIMTAADHGNRDLLLVLLLASTGLRVSEALALDLDQTEYVRGHCTIVVTGKGGTEHRITLPPLVCNVVDAIAEAEGRTTGPMLTDSTGTRMNRNQANRALARLGNRAGIDRKVTPHMLRTTAITEALEAGTPLRDVQDFARHADPKTTRRYDRARGGLERNAATSAAVMAALTYTDF